MKIFGYELGKRWYFDANLEIEYLQRHLEELDEMKAEMIQMAPPNNEHIKNAVANLDSMIERHQRNLAKKRQSLQKFFNMVNSLPDTQKQFAKLHYIDGKTIEETAELMCYSVGGLHRIRRKAEKGIEAHINRIEQGTTNKV